MGTVMDNLSKTSPTAPDVTNPVLRIMALKWSD